MPKNSPDNIKNNNPFIRADIHNKDILTHLERINKEFADGFAFLAKYPKSVTIFGSSTAGTDTSHYKLANELTSRIVKDTGYAVVTGGGPGIMEASNKGALDAGGTSIGLNISLPHEHNINPFVTDSMKFSYFFSRKTMLEFAAEAYVFFPGGFGTFDELFGVLTLIQAGKIPRVPVILMDSKFWNNFESFVEKSMVHDFKTIEPHDLKIYEITDDIDRVVEIIQKAPVTEWWRNIN